jgi:hypothetical protein
MDTTSRIRIRIVGTCAAAAAVTSITIGPTATHADQAASECGVTTTSYPRSIDEHVDLRKKMMAAAYVARRR